jgi:hypothetical protein
MTDLRRKTDKICWERGLNTLLSFSPQNFWYPLNLLGIIYLFYEMFFDFCEIIIW